MVITSTKNEKIKFVKKIKDDKNYLFLDSPKLIEEAIASRYELKYLIIEENKREKFRDIFEDIKKYDCEIIEVTENVFKALSETVWSQGIIGITMKKERGLAPPKGNFLVLDEVQDPGNVGTLIRSALGSGFEDVYLLNCASLSNEKVVRSTMGAIFKARTYELSREEFIKFFDDFKSRASLLVADMKGDNIYKTKIKTPCGIVVGNEGNGVSEEIKAISKGKVSIPMANSLESLNASVAGSIIMFKIANQ